MEIEGYNRAVDERWDPISERWKQAQHRLLYPEPGSRIEAARKAGVDTALLAQQLRLTPQERAERMLEICALVEQLVDGRGKLIIEARIPGAEPG
jgi:hypothetical protein